MAGGQLIRDTMVPEEYFDKLEVETFISLCQEEKTQDRIMHMLKTGKPLRN
jgi:3-hydroxyacyl-CoA dehydrogenase